MPKKVQLISEKRGDWFARSTRPLKALLPFYQREGGGYVHRARSADMHYDDDGTRTHTSVKFWCGTHGFLYPPGKQQKKHRPAIMTASPDPCRVICATCEGRAHGAGQVGDGKLAGRFAKYRPHSEFFPARAGAE